MNPFRKYTLDWHLFSLTIPLSMNDWRKMRGEEYWETRDKIATDELRKEFLFKKVCEYTGNNYIWENYKNK
jgi:hypothetical protein